MRTDIRQRASCIRSLVHLLFKAVVFSHMRNQEDELNCGCSSPTAVYQAKRTKKFGLQIEFGWKDRGGGDELSYFYTVKIGNFSQILMSSLNLLQATWVLEVKA